MHQRDICLCSECIARIYVEEAREAERVATGRAWFEASRAQRRPSEPVSSGVVRRRKKAA